uniref:Uncharacterized protein n=1 Tax=Haptolina brevifila TaxID=156173 RepID=A0A7S2GR08_9EUKA|mmetsp:Transcript_44835/g.89552  ORF Transcript_44835/g.89552 Transcript_44835/m.89552 type:complete len:200 (+) Transcript_44835:1-600(+)
MAGMPGMQGMPGIQGMGGMPGGMRGMPGGMRQQPEQPGVMPSGTPVCVYGLKGAAQHNGKTGQVESYDGQSERYVVDLGEGEQVRIRFDNLAQMIDVEVTGMQNRADLNGKGGRIAGYDEEKDRYHIDIQGVGRASLLLNNLILPANTRGKVVGLTSESGSKWNDKIGKLLSFDREAGRYLIQMTKDEQLRVKPQNLRL